MDACVHNSSRAPRFHPTPCRGSLPAMTEVMHTPPALRWVALFLAACAVLGLFLGFRDQIRKNPPGWYTGAEQVATPLPATADGAREAVAFDPNAPRATTSAASTVVPSPKAEPSAADQADAQEAADAPPPPVLVPTTQPVQPAPATPRPKAAPPPPAQKAPTRPAPPSDPVGDILEGQKQPEPPATVPY